MNAATRLLVLPWAVCALAAVGPTAKRARCDDRSCGSNRDETMVPDAAVSQPPVATRPAGSARMPTDLMTAFQQARHRIVREQLGDGDGGAYLASNYSQELRARFETGAVVVTPRNEGMGGWALRLRTTGWGRDGAMRALGVSERVASGQRLEYRHPGFTEWYVNEPGDGIEQGFTVATRPAGRGRLRIELATEGLRAEIVGERAALLRAPDGDAALRYEGLVVDDATGRELPARLLATSGALVLEVEDRGAAYPVTVDPLIASFQAKLLHRTLEGVEADALSGYSVAVDGDTALVGAPGDDNTYGGTDAGSVHVFTRSGTTWTLQAVLVADDRAAGDAFGQSVALDGDTALVGAYADDTPGGTDAGSAYVFVRIGTNWAPHSQLLAGDGAPNDLFGESVALSGDTALVGARADDTNGIDAGAAYVFTRSGNTWTQQQELVAYDAEQGDWFGIAVALDGDTAVVGARLGDLIGLLDPGAAYVFTRSGGTWTQQQKLIAADPASGDQLGVSVSLSGDTALVGAWHAGTAAGSGAGAAYVYTRSGLTWTQQQKLVAADGAADDSFGISVSLSGDTALVGARLDDSPGDVDVGSAYVFTRSGASWTQQQKLVAGDGAAGDELGIAVALSGDTALVGAWRDDTASGNQAGSAYVFTRGGSAWSQQQRLLPSDGAGFDQLGISASLSGDTALVGAPSEDTAGGSDAGAAYVFTRTGASWALQRQLLAADGAVNDEFGHSVSLSGDMALVGAWRAGKLGAANVGAAYVFTRTGTTWTQQQKLVAGNGAENDWFGASVSLSGDTALVGAPLDDTPAGANAGSAYVFTRAAATWTQQQQLVADDGAVGDQFGTSVSLSENSALVGAPWDNGAGGANAGSAYVFIRTAATWTQQQQLLADDGASLDLFGDSVSLSGDTALVGARLDDTPRGTDTGSAYVFNRAGTTWSQQQKLLADDGAPDDRFGAPVSLAGDRALVGAPGNDTGAGADAGSAYLFTRTGTVWSQRAQLLAFDGAAGNGFGHSVSLSGDTALVGAPLFSTVAGLFAGAAYAFLITEPAYLYTLTPCRVFDSREPSDGPALTSGQVRVIPVYGRCGVPSSARAISFNVTAMGSTGGGHLTAYPANLGLPPTSTINFKVGQTRANNGVVSLATDGTGTLALRPAVAGGGTVHVIVDVNGYFE